MIFRGIASIWFQLPTHKAKMGVALGKYEYTLLLHPTEVGSKSL